MKRIHVINQKHVSARSIVAAGTGLFVLSLMGCADGLDRGMLEGDAPQAARMPDSSPPLAQDESRNLYIPPQDQLVRTLRVSAVYNDTHVQIRYEFPTEEPSWYHDYFIYEGGEWVRYGSGPVGPQEHGLYEDRISVAIDAGNIEGYETYGGFLISHPGIRSRTDEIGRDEVVGHPHLGDRLGETDVRKFLAGSRYDTSDENIWRRVRTEEELNRLREEGRFLDTWQWRAHRSNPHGYADNGYVLDYRFSAEGRGMYTTNWVDEHERPRWMFDPEKVGFSALEKERLLARDYGQDDIYYLKDDFAVPLDPDHDWQEGDVIPRRILREPTGSRGSLRADGRWKDGAWRVAVTRSLESPNPLDSHEIKPGEVYNVQFAVHTGQMGARWHYVSMPLVLGFDSGGDGVHVEAVRSEEGDLRDENAPWHEVPLFYPGQATAREIRENSQLNRAVHAAARAPFDEVRIRTLANQLVQHEKITIMAPPARRR